MKIELTSREAEILELIILEYTSSEIAQELFITPATVKSHRKNLLMKLNARNVAGMVRRAFEYNIVSLYQ